MLSGLADGVVEDAARALVEHHEAALSQRGALDWDGTVEGLFGVKLIIAGGHCWKMKIQGRKKKGEGKVEEGGRLEEVLEGDLSRGR